MIYLLLATVFYTVAIILAAAASRSANPTLVTGMINTISALIPLAVVAPMLRARTFAEQKHGLLLALAAGVAIAVFTICLNRSYSLHKVGVVTPIVFGGAIFLSAILSYFVFREKLSAYHVAGLTAVGIGLLLIIVAKVTGR